MVPHEPMPVLVHPGREPRIQRTAASGRFRGRAKVDGMLPVETRYLAGGATLAAYVVGKAIVDPAFRAALGSPASLPRCPRTTWRRSRRRRRGSGGPRRPTE